MYQKSEKMLASNCRVRLRGGRTGYSVILLVQSRTANAAGALKDYKTKEGYQLYKVDDMCPNEATRIMNLRSLTHNDPNPNMAVSTN